MSAINRLRMMDWTCLLNLGASTGLEEIEFSWVQEKSFIKTVERKASVHKKMNSISKSTTMSSARSRPTV